MANIIISIVGVFASVLLCILTIATNRLFKRFDEMKADIKAVADRLQTHEDRCADRDIQMARLLGNLETAVTGRISRDKISRDEEET